MGYNKQNFYDGQTLRAAHLKKIEDGIIAVEKEKVSQTDYNKKLIKIDEDIENSKMVWSGKGNLPVDTEHVLAMDYEEEILYYKDENQIWQKIAQVGGGYSKITFVEDYSVEYGEELKNIIISGTEDGYKISFGWSSEAAGVLLEDDGICSIYVDNIKKESFKCPYTRYRYADDDTEKENPIPINPIERDIRKFLKAGTNNIKVEIQDAYKNTSYFEFIITVVDIVLAIPTGGYSQNTISYYKFGTTEISKQTISLTVTTSIETVVRLDYIKEDKTVETLEEKIISSTGNLDFFIPRLEHGNHLIKFYAQAYQNGEIIAESNELYFDVIWVDNIGNNPKAILASSFSVTEVDQYQYLKIPYFIYAPNRIEAYTRFKIAEKGKEDEVEYSNLTLKSTQTELFWEVAYNEQLDIIGGEKQPKEVNFIIEIGKLNGDVFIIEDSKIFPITILPVEEPNLSVDTGENLIFKFVAETVDNTPETLNEWKLKYKTSNEAISAAMTDTAGNLTGVDGKISKWQMYNNRPALKLSNEGRFTLPLPIFDQRSGIEGATGLPNFTSSGMTLEMDLSFDNVTDYNEPFFICGTETNGVFKGIRVTPNEALLSCGNASAKTNYETSESKNFSKSMRISFVIQPLTTMTNEEYNLNRTVGGMYIYINGIGTSAIDYGSSENFQNSATPYFIGKGCDIYLHNISFYKKQLTQTEILNTWVMDMQMGDAVNAAKKNDIYNDNDKVTVDFKKCNTKLPCMIITGPLPQSKGDKKSVSIDFYGLEDEKNIYSFSLPGAQIDVQGTSSQYYPVKNWKFKPDKNAADPNFYIGPPGQADRSKGGSYSLGPNQIAEKTFCLKADYMETASCHNTVTANIANNMYNKTNEGKTPPQRADKTGKTRTTIYGRPILVFYRETETSDLRFGGKYNFNYDKDAEKVFGFEDKEAINGEMLECVEFCQNREKRCLLQESDYTEIVTGLDSAGLKEYDERSHIKNADGTYTSAYKWGNCFEFRYFYHGENAAPSPIAYLKEVTDWIVAVDITKANKDEPIPEYRTKTGVVSYEYDQNMQIITFKDDLGRTRNSLDITEDEIYELGYKIETYYQTNYYEPTYNESGEVIGKEFKNSDIQKVEDKLNFVPPQETEYVQGRYYYALYYDEIDGEIFVFNRNTEVYRLTKFKTELPEHFNEHYCLMYFLLMELLGMIDSSTKNMFWVSWGERHSNHPYGKDNVVIWYPIFYDMDTMLGINNVGKMNIPYNVEFDSVIGKEIDKNGIEQNVYAYNGHDNVFWNLFRKAYETELSDLFRTKVSEGTFSLNSILNQYKEHTLNFPEAIYNEDGALKILDFFFSSEVYLGDTDEEGNTVPKFPDWLYVYQGDRYYYRNYWLPNRFYYLLSKYRSGSYVSDFISMRLNNPYLGSAVPSEELKPNYDFDIVTWKDQYTRIKYGGQSVVERSEAEKTTHFTAPLDSYNDTEAAIFGASNIKEISSFSHKYLNSLDLSAATRLLKVDIGSDIVGYSNSTLDKVSFGSNRLLQHISLRNCVGLKQSINISSCPNVKYFDARGTKITSVDFPSSGILEDLYLPNTINTLKISNQTKLKTFELPTSGETYALQTLSVQNTPFLNTKDLVEKSIDANLEVLELYDANWRMPNGELLKKIKTKAENGELYDSNLNSPILRGTFYVDRLDDYSIKDLKAYFNNMSKDDIKDDETLEDQEGRAFKLIVVVQTVPTYEIKFFNSDGKTVLETGLYGNRIEDGQTFDYLQNHSIPPKKSEWDRNFVFTGWNVTYTTSEGSEVKKFLSNDDLKILKIQFDITVVAVHIDKPKIFTFIFTDSPIDLYEKYKNTDDAESFKDREFKEYTISLLAYSSENFLNLKDTYNTTKCDVSKCTESLPISSTAPKIPDHLVGKYTYRFNTWINNENANKKIKENSIFSVLDFIQKESDKDETETDEYVINYTVEPVQSANNYYVTFKDFEGNIINNDGKGKQIYYLEDEIIPPSIHDNFQDLNSEYRLVNWKSNVSEEGIKNEFNYNSTNKTFEQIFVSKEVFGTDNYEIIFTPTYSIEDRYYTINLYTTTDEAIGPESVNKYEPEPEKTETVKYDEKFMFYGKETINGGLNGHTTAGVWKDSLKSSYNRFDFSSKNSDFETTIKNIYNGRENLLGEKYAPISSTTINLYPIFTRKYVTVTFKYYITQDSKLYSNYSYNNTTCFKTITIENVYQYGDIISDKHKNDILSDSDLHWFNTKDCSKITQNSDFPWNETITNLKGNKTYTARYAELDKDEDGNYIPNRYYDIYFNDSIENKKVPTRYGLTPTVPSTFSIDRVFGNDTLVIVDYPSVEAVTGSVQYNASVRKLRTENNLSWSSSHVTTSGYNGVEDKGGPNKFRLYTEGVQDYAGKQFKIDAKTYLGTSNTPEIQKVVAEITVNASSNQKDWWGNCNELFIGYTALFGMGYPSSVKVHGITQPTTCTLTCQRGDSSNMDTPLQNNYFWIGFFDQTNNVTHDNAVYYVEISDVNFTITFRTDYTLTKGKITL